MCSARDSMSTRSRTKASLSPSSKGEIEVRGLGQRGGSPPWTRRVREHQQITYSSIGLTSEPGDTDTERAVIWRKRRLWVEDKSLAALVSELPDTPRSRSSSGIRASPRSVWAAYSTPPTREMHSSGLRS